MVMPWARATCPKSSWTLVTFLGFGPFLVVVCGFGPFLWYFLRVDLRDFWLLWLCPGLEQLAQRVPELLSLFLGLDYFCTTMGLDHCCGIFFGVDLSDFWLLWLCPGLEQLAQRVPGLLSPFLIVTPFCVDVFWVWTILCGIFFWVDLSDFWLLWLCPGLEQLAQRVPGLLSFFFWVWTVFL